ncbi:bicaudal-D-related protein 2-like [Triplophysa rosa]|uniref:Bicaudal D-related protein 2-like n=1 Tax=Triplophysa rosa TaxID=992332 RepID=A0A9W7WET9_TRIRA|nr:bicaudal-D-related protein 2-like [Triplophysa rosa]KAI7796459.1 putative bicaudal D-related protein 2-like [Triplophysa rosa]
METYRRHETPVTLHTIGGLRDSPLTINEIHKRFTDDEDSVSVNDVVGRETCRSPLSSLDELQEQLEGDDEDSVETYSNDGLGQMTQIENSEPDSTSRNPNRSFIDEALPDLLRSGSPLRRRVSSPVSATLKQVKKEVELSRRRSLKLKAQVDKLQQQNESGPGWSQNKQRVTEEVESVVKLLLPLTDLEASDLPSEANPLDTALRQLQNVARRLALSQARGKPGEDAAILQQALRDRDEAMAKKQAMESELLKSKNEMMTLNNQLLEAVQSRLELSIELEAWKDDVQTILHHQLLKQQQEEQAQKKSSRFSVLRRSNKPLPPKPNYPTMSSPVSSPRSSSPNTSGTPRWTDKFKRGKTSMQDPVVDSQPQRTNGEDNFQVVSLD